MWVTAALAAELTLLTACLGVEVVRALLVGRIRATPWQSCAIAYGRDQPLSFWTAWLRRIPMGSLIGLLAWGTVRKALSGEVALPFGAASWLGVAVVGGLLVWRVWGARGDRAAAPPLRVATG